MSVCEVCGDEAIDCDLDMIEREPIEETVNAARAEQFAKLGWKVEVGQVLRWWNCSVVAKHFHCKQHRCGHRYLKEQPK